MNKKKFVLDGHNMKTIEGFFVEFQKVLCPSFKHFGRNWDAVYDILRGGFGTFEVGEEIIIQVKYKNYIARHLGDNFLNKFETIIDGSENIEFLYSND